MNFSKKHLKHNAYTCAFFDVHMEGCTHVTRENLKWWYEYLTGRGF